MFNVVIKDIGTIPVISRVGFSATLARASKTLQCRSGTCRHSVHSFVNKHSSCSFPKFRVTPSQRTSSTCN